MTDALGQNAWVGIATEDIFGSLKARSKFFQIQSEGVKEIVDKEYANTLDEASTDENDTVIKKKAAAGPITVLQRWEGLELLFKHFFGQVTTTTPDATNAPTGRQHVFTFAQTQLSPGLSFEICRDVKSMLIAGCKIKQIKFTLPLGGFLTCEITMVGSIVTYDTAGSPTYSDKLIIKSTDVVSTFITYGVSQLKVRAFDITASVPVDEDDTDFTTQTIGEMFRTGHFNVEGSLECKWDATDRRDDFVAATSRALQAKFEGATIGGSVKQTFQIDCPAIKIIDFDNSVKAVGRVYEKLNFKAMKSGSNRELKLTLINTVTTV